MRHLIADDDYDDYGDDYYDDYDDYTGGSTAMQSKKTKAKTPPKKPAPSKAKSPVVTKGAAKKNSNPTVISSPKKATAATTPMNSPASPPPLTPRTATVPPELQYNATNDEQQRVPLTLVVLGHVDAGKSTLTGRLLHYAQNSTTTHRPQPKNFAWLLDEDEQERAHGITMDIATKQLDTATRFRLVLQDAPGHADFVPAMITGTAAADAALLTVDASDHAANFLSKQVQLREHVVLAKGLGVSQVLVVLNKMDLVGWDQADTYQRLEAQVRAYLTTNVGYPAHRVRCIPVSGGSGVNVTPSSSPSAEQQRHDTETLRSWYAGPTLWEALDSFEPPAQQPKLLEKPLRLVVADIVEGSNAVSIRAKVVSGWIQQGEQLVVLPVGDTTSLQKITSVHHQHAGVSNRHYFGSGELLDGTLSGMDIQRIATGSVLTRPSERPTLATVCRCKLFILDTLTIPLIRGAHVMFHMHYVDVPCHLHTLLRTLEPDTGATKQERPRALTKRTSAIVELKLAVPICMEAFVDCRALGRFVLRRSGESVAIGRIEQVMR